MSAALCRQQAWWAYAPEELLPLIMPDEAAGDNAAAAERSQGARAAPGGPRRGDHAAAAAIFDPASLRTGILTDLVRTIKVRRPRLAPS